MAGNGNVNSGSDRINQSGFKLSRSGSVRQAGTVAEGSGGTGRGATARAGTLGSGSGTSGNDMKHWYKAYSAQGSPVGAMPQKWKPTPGRGSVRGSGG